MRLEFIGKTKGRITKVRAHTIKLGQKDNRPAKQFMVRATAPNSVLNQLSPRMRALLFEKAAGSEKMQKQLEGVEVVSDLPNLTAEGEKLGALHWNDEQTGSAFIIDRAIEPLRLPDCKVSAVVIHSKDGGTVLIDFLVVTGELDVETCGLLDHMNNSDVMFELTAPEVHQQAEIDDGDQQGGDDAGDQRTPEQALAEQLQNAGTQARSPKLPRKTPMAKKIARASAKRAKAKA